MARMNEHVQGRTLSTAGQAECSERTDGTEDVGRNNSGDS